MVFRFFFVLVSSCISTWLYSQDCTSFRLAEPVVIQPSCTVANDGEVTLQASGGSGPYRYMWDSGIDTFYYDRLGIGTYAVTVTDDVGCQVSKTFTLTSDIVFDAQIDQNKSNLEVCEGNLGIVEVITNTSAPFMAQDEEGRNLGNTIALAGGQHTITIYTEGGCRDDIAIDVISLPIKPAFTAPIPAALCTDQEYALEVTVLLPADEVSGLINQDSWNFDDVTVLDTGTYKLGLYSIRGCFWDTTFTISGDDTEIDLVDSIVIDQSDQVTITGPDDPGLIYSWESANTFSCLDDNCSSIEVTVEVTDVIIAHVTTSSGCTLRDEVVIDVIPEELPSADEPSIPVGFFVPNSINLRDGLISDLCIYTSNQILSIQDFTLVDRWGNIAVEPVSGMGDICLPHEDVLDLTMGVYIYYVDPITII